MHTIDAVKIVEVGPRDGLQNVKTIIPTPTKLTLIERLYNAGLRTIEVTSVVSPQAIPQLADCRAVLSHVGLQKLIQEPSTRLPVLIPNLKGLEVAKQHAVKEVAVFVSASEGFSRANIRCSVQEGIDRAAAVAVAARKEGILVRGYISCIFQCPYDGLVPLNAVLNCCRQLLAMGCYEISLGDTLGVGVASDVVHLLEYLEKGGISKGVLAGHFHDTYGQALSNVWAAYQRGIRVFDSSVAGLGGCPYAPGAKGNLATEDVAYLFQQAGIETGINLPELVDVGVWISGQLKIENSSRTGKALATKKNPNKASSSGVSGSPIPADQSRSIQWTSYVSQEGYDVVRNGANVKIILNRPKNGNALTTAVISNLTNFFERTASDSSISRIAITARGKYFCTGMDLAKGTTPVSQGVSASDAQYERLTRLFQAIDSSPQVTIACVQGPSFGGGVGLAFACDIRILTGEATFTLSEVKLGLSPATISKYVVREWGAAFSREAMLSTRQVSADELKRLGIVTQVVNSEAELSQALDSYLIRLKTAAPKASARSKELVRLGCLEGGKESKQAAGIEKLFRDMMSGNEEAAFGLAQFQAGNKALDWDEYVSRQLDLKAKL